MANSFSFNSVDMSAYGLRLLTHEEPFSQETPAAQLPDRAYGYSSLRSPIPVSLYVKVYAADIATLKSYLDSIKQTLNQRVDCPLAIDTFDDRYWMVRFVSMVGEIQTARVWKGTITFSANDPAAYDNDETSNDKETALVIAESGEIEVETGDGTLLYNGYIYITGRDSKVAKVNASNYSDVLVVEIDEGAAGYIDAIVETGGFIWIGGCNNAGSYLYKLNASTLSIEDSWLIFAGYGIYAMCVDDDYIYCAGWNGLGSPDIAKFKLSDNSITNNTTSLNAIMHSLCEDGDSLYGHTIQGSGGQHIFKILKSDLSLSLSTEVTDPNTILCDDIVQDETYFYLTKETGTPYTVFRYTKSDLGVTSFSPVLGADYASGSSDGLLLTDGKIISGKDAPENGYYILRMIDQSEFSREIRVKLTGLSHQETKINEIILDGNYIHLTRNISGGNVYLGKFNKADILAVAESFTETAGGTEQVFPVYTLTCDDTLTDTTVVLTNTATGEALTWEGSLVNTDVLEIDAVNGTVKLNGAEDMVNVSGEFPRLLPGSNAFTVDGFSGNLNITYRPRYV